MNTYQVRRLRRSVLNVMLNRCTDRYYLADTLTDYVNSFTVDDLLQAYWEYLADGDVEDLGIEE